MITITINEETNTIADMATALRQIADELEKGYINGIAPTFNLSGEEEK